MSANLGELDTLRNLARRLDEAGHGRRAGIVDEACRLLCCSRQTVYRKLKERVGWTSGRKPRADRGKLSIPEDVAVKAAHLIHKATRANGKRTMNMTTARDILEESGLGHVDEETGEVVMPKAATTLSRAMRAYGCHPDMLRTGKPHTRMRSLHPNQCWQLDPSLCVLFYLPKGKVRIMDGKRFYKNKPAYAEKAAKERVWRYVITDHYSGSIYVRYVQAPGESAQGLVDVFLDAVSHRGGQDPLHGVPFDLLLDKGSANTAHLFTNLAERLGVRILTHEAGNPRAKGQVECANNIVETQFESRLSFLRIESVEQLQAEADKWRRHFNARARHSRTGKTRNEVWLTIGEDQLRLAPPLELCRELVTTRPEEKTVRDDLSISHSVKGHGRNDYDLRMVGGILPGIKVKVVVNPYRAPAVDVIMADPLTREERAWTVEPVRKNEAGFWESAAVIGREYKALPETKAEKMLKRIDEAAGPNPKRHNAPEGVDVLADIKPSPECLPRRGRDLGLDAMHREPAPHSVVEAAMLLKKRLGDDWTGEAYAWLTQRYPEGVPAGELDSIAERFGAKTAAPALLKLVANQG